MGANRDIASGVFLAWVSVAQGLTMDWVIVGDASNAADTRIMQDHTTGYGAVGYEYLIGKYEVTNAQYIDFLNAVAVLNDPAGLYDDLMASSSAGGIARSGNAGSYSYGSRNGDTNWLLKPVTYVDWYDTLRFANWMHNGQPTGAQDHTTTEDGAYTFTGETFLDQWGNTNWVVGNRNSVARVWLPSEDEWYKAAYYKGGGTQAGYWEFATRSNVAPDNNAPVDDTGNSANYEIDGQLAVGGPYFVTDVGAYGLSAGPYGTFDQNGNLAEWNEAELDQRRGLRGGCWYYSSYNDLAAGRRMSSSPASGIYRYGFRLAAVIPEPTALQLLALGATVLLRRRRRF